MFDRQKINQTRKDFPMLNDREIYFDNAATTFKPHVVIDAVLEYYNNYSYNVGRGDYLKAYSVEQKVEEVRSLIADFINADKNEVIFTSGATESLNTIAFSYGLQYLKAGDVILTSLAEHASNILPWFKVAELVGASIEYVELDQYGDLSLENFKAAMHDKVKVVSLAAMTNVLGNVLPIKEIAKVTHDYGAIIVCDGAQSVAHNLVDVKDLDVDFLAFSGHKMLAPTGVGVIYAKYSILDKLQPFFQGGGSNSRYTQDGSLSYKKPPYKFENGTPPIEAILGFGAAIKYLNEQDFAKLIAYEQDLVNYFIEEMSKLDNVEIYNPNSTSGIVAFNIKGIFSQDVSTYLDTQGIQVRSGHHCSKLLNNVIKANDTVRASVYFYNTFEEVDRFVEVVSQTTLEKTINIFV
ncbi:MAG: cysteine desulfurase [Erysipelothrix sp.]|nr:cysteine desulfurase [Erysipelothrix sp.]